MESVAEGLCEVFSRTGILSQILTDQGSVFTRSNCVAYLALSISSLVLITLKVTKDGMPLLSLHSENTLRSTVIGTGWSNTFCLPVEQLHMLTLATLRSSLSLGDS